MKILIDDQVENRSFSVQDVEELAIFTLRELGCPENSEVSISFVEEIFIQELNCDFLGTNKVTDVLSFECDNLDDEFANDFEIYQLGDIVICPDFACKNADFYGCSFAEEIELLVVHGLLHLNGYDHVEDVDAQAMESKEDEILKAYANGFGR
ncbi:MAG: rRNA maturation RNase YbeY [Eggerthellaceae bacterium]|nr:rRNA maturation RNase YbeY [Eggerthellaceae bacterium]